MNKDLNLFLEYLAEIQGANQKLTVSSYKTILEEMIDYMFEGDTEKATFENIAKIRSSEYSIKWLSKLEKQGLKSATINKRIAVLSRLYTYMIGELYCTTNTARTIPRSNGNVKDKRVVDQGEAITLLKYTNSHKNDSKLSFRNHLMVAILLSNGLRCSELEYLRIQDVNLETGETILTRWTEEGGVKFSKTRIVYLNNKILEDLNYYIDNYRPTSKDGDILFLSKTGRKISSRDILRIINKVSTNAGLDKINTHALRACHSSVMINGSSENLDVVRKELGHSSSTTTLNHYFNSDKDKLKELSNSNPLFDVI
ncbi:MAG: tyrosine-type recombinase/integrase [Intestinibacter bartlettii]|jgi:integrase/recombinase XerC|nr:tyrosine-type recombinase/integrase [Intestinibacter bartlettii]